ncbi:MAG: sugar transferase [Microthrixaceae bacterium]|nr:sugar transferase [Microthrixaceae bacterium]
MANIVGARAPENPDQLVDFDFQSRTLRRTGAWAKVALATADTLTMLATSLLVMAATAQFSDWGAGSWQTHLWLLAASVPIWPTVFVQHKMYGTRFVTRLLDETRRAAHAIFIGIVALVVIAALTKLDVSRAYLAALWIFGNLALGFERYVARRIFARRRSRGASMKRVLVIGTSTEALALRRMFMTERHLGYDVVAFVDDDPKAPAAIDGIPVHSNIDDLVPLADANQAQGVIIASTALSLERSNHLVRELSEAGLHVEITWPLRDIASNRLTVRPLGRFPVAYVEPVARYGWRRLAKRTFDVVLSGTGLLIVSPFLAIAALAVKLTSPGPVLFRQTRVGQHARPFEVLKLRTMVVDAEDRLEDLSRLNEADGPMFKMSDDPRITRVGAILRKTSIDELPQLWNVVKGEMSLVGPRPALPSEMAEWDSELYNRLRVKPGITGMWQVNGRSESSFADYQRLDLYYVDNWSILVDAGILAKTLPVVLSSRGAM